ncbi:hypothetical protein [Spirosoma flavum]|uniref:Uncharacterized protein n=1 Tax=Spirosoma flavum TaxID=2048557 RepID=A0ABW6ALU4_9BACT
MTSLFIPQTLTLADIDRDCDHSELDYLINKQAGPYCTSIEFNDDNFKHDARRAFEYAVRTSVHNGRTDRDESGRFADTSSVRDIIYVHVHPEMSLDQIAESVAKAVREIDNNVFA